MDAFSNGLFRMLVRFEVIRLDQNEYAVAIFAVGCAIIGLLAVAADLAYFLIRGQSVLNVRHGFRSTPLFAFAWALGALVIGYLGQAANIFQVSLFACATVGIAWPVIFTELLKRAERNEEVQTPKAEE